MSHTSALRSTRTMATLKAQNTAWLAAAKAQAELSDGVAALAARIGADSTRGADDIQELWRLVRLARTIGA